MRDRVVIAREIDAAASSIAVSGARLSDGLLSLSED